MEGNLRFKIEWASLTVGRKFTVFALFYFVFEGNFPVQAQGGLYMEGRFNGRFFALQVWGSYIWRGLYMGGLIFGILRYLLFENTRKKNLKLNLVLEVVLSSFSNPERFLLLHRYKRSYKTVPCATTPTPTPILQFVWESAKNIFRGGAITVAESGKRGGGWSGVSRRLKCIHHADQRRFK